MRGLPAKKAPCKRLANGKFGGAAGGEGRRHRKGKVKRLADELAPLLANAFAGNGVYCAAVAEGDDVERLRRAARKAARKMGIPVQTRLSSDGATLLVANNRPVTDEERSRAVRALEEIMRGQPN